MGQHGQPADERTRVDALQQHREDVATGDADRRDQPIEEQRDEGRRQHPGHHQALNRIDAQHSHRVDFLTDGARTQVGADCGGPGPGHHQHGDDGPQLGDGSERGARTGQVGGADLTKENVEGERHQNGEWDRHQQRRDQRNPGDHPGLVEELTELKRPLECLAEGVQGHLDETAHSPRRDRELFEQPGSLLARASPRLRAKPLCRRLRRLSLFLSPQRSA